MGYVKNGGGRVGIDSHDAIRGLHACGKLNRARNAKADAEASKAAYDEKLAHAKEEAVDIIKAAQERADRLGDEIVSEAKLKADDMIKRADAEIAQERKKAVNELKNEISFISIGIAEKMLDREINEADHDELISRFIEEMGEDDE